MRRIDAHCHIIVEEITTSHGNEPWRTHIERQDRGIYATMKQMRNGPMHHECTNVDTILSEMDALRIDTMLICPPPFLFFYDLPAWEGTKVSRIQNEAMAKIAARHPDRFAPLATIPLQDVEAACSELHYATHELGLHGVEIGSNVRGIHLGDKRFRPFWQMCAQEDLFVFIHPEYFQTHSSPTLNEYYLVNLVGNPYETGLTAAHMVFSGLFEELPDLKVMLAHAGGIMPWIMGRWSRGYQQRPEAKRVLQHDPLTSVRKFYVDTITHSPAALSSLIATFGADHVVVGSDYPFDMGLDDPIGQIESLEGLNIQQREAILGGTIARLLKLA
jgi:aminocarboxymuconate-semialdehyde decarboxylase